MATVPCARLPDGRVVGVEYARGMGEPALVRRGLPTQSGCALGSKVLEAHPLTAGADQAGNEQNDRFHRCLYLTAKNAESAEKKNPITLCVFCGWLSPHAYLRISNLYEPKLISNPCSSRADFR